MAARGDSKDFMSSPLDGQGARHKDSYYAISDENAAELRDTDAEFRRLKADFLRMARNRRRRGLSQGDSSRSPSPVRRQPPRRSANLPKVKIATFYSTDVELWFNQIETQLDLHQITDDDERYILTFAALSGEVASDVRDVSLQPFLTHKYENLKVILIERRGLTTPERVNKVISGEKLGSDILSRFLRRLQKTAGFGTKAVVGKVVIRQAFIRQMSPSVRAHLDKMYQIITKKIVVLTHRRRKRRKVTLLNRSTQLTHLFVFITKHSVTEHARAENLARFL